jgi:glycosyltransferase involved in cell wall biosynthesis
VSLCLIVKDEEPNLDACLASVDGLFDEIVVVDTGSTDRTKEIARRHGAKVFDFPWVDSFAAARNASLEHATSQWIFWLDADDRLDAENRQTFRALLATLGDENAAYALKCRCLPDPTTGAVTVVDHVRLFRNRPDVRWRYRVHEQILPVRLRPGDPARLHRRGAAGAVAAGHPQPRAVAGGVRLVGGRAGAARRAGVGARPRRGAQQPGGVAPATRRLILLAQGSYTWPLKNG